MAGTNERRALVNLSVVAGSAAMFAAAWAGIAAADGERYAQDVPATTAMALAPVLDSAAPAMNPAPVAGDGEASTAPAPRRVVIVRQSRAS